MAFAQAVKRAGLATDDPAAKVVFHTLRATFASLYAQRTGDMVRLQKILGHSSVRTTERSYARFAPDYVVGATAMLEGLGAAPISAPSTHAIPTAL